MEKKIKSKIEIELTEKEAGHLRTLLEGGIKISDSISQGEVFENILDHLNSQDQEEESKLEEEWEKEFKFSYGYLYIQNEDGEFCKINGETEDIIDFIKQLLEDREREVLQEIIGMAKTMAKDYYSGNTQLYLDVRNVQDKLDKLNNKKK